MNIDELPGWFAESNRAGIDWLIKELQCTSGIEIGCFLGLSSVFLAQRLHRLQCVDTWRENSYQPDENNLVATLARIGCPRDFYHVWERNVAEFEVWHKITPVRGFSHEVHQHVVDADLVYVDGNHTERGCASDLALYGPKAKKVICGDDYVARPGFGVIEAVTAAYPNHEHSGPFWWAVPAR